MSIVITEQAIRESVSRLYGCEYTGEIKITFLKAVNRLTELEEVYGTKVTLGMNNVDKPISIAVDLTEHAFLSYFEKEILIEVWTL